MCCLNNLLASFDDSCIVMWFSSGYRPPSDSKLRPWLLLLTSSANCHNTLDLSKVSMACPPHSRINFHKIGHLHNWPRAVSNLSSRGVPAELATRSSPTLLLAEAPKRALLSETPPSSPSFGGILDLLSKPCGSFAPMSLPDRLERQTATPTLTCSFQVLSTAFSDDATFL